MKALEDVTTETVSWEDTQKHKVPYVFEAEAKWAVNTAIYSGRPLLVRGEPGVGKSQLAQAAAHRLGVPLVARVLHGRTETEELFWEVDAVSRLAQAQLLGATAHLGGLEHQKVWEELDLKNFVKPGPLWWAFDWKNAATFKLGRKPWAPVDWSPSQGCVLLLDEIDKCDSAIPNGLLEALGAGQFDSPLGDKVQCQNGFPLVIITTNEERTLPPAFLRRCVVLYLRFSEANLFDRGRAHSPQASDALLNQATTLLLESRDHFKNHDWRPGQAEYLDLIRAVVAAAPSEAEQLAWLTKLQQYAYLKQQDLSKPAQR